MTRNESNDSMKQILVLILIIFVSMSFFIFGFSSGVYHYFPFEIINNAKRIVIGCYDPGEYPQIFETDVTSLIKIQNQQDIIMKKEMLIDFIWSGEKFPSSKLPDIIDKSIIDLNYEDMKNLKNIEKLMINMEYGINSVGYIFLPEESNNNLVIYHQVHKGDFIHGKKTIQFFLDEGYSVLALSMPLYGMNSQPIIDLPNYGKIKFIVHNQFNLLDNSQFSSIKFFIEPVAVSLNYIDKVFEFDSYSMIGVSGGGWTTILYSSIDDRISKNYAVTGMYPAYLHQLYHPADYERIVSELYENANALELFVMSAYGDNRVAVQIFNKNDPGGRCGEFYKTYEESVKTKMSELGKGAFYAYLDETNNEHKISEHALSIIINHMNN